MCLTDFWLRRADTVYYSKQSWVSTYFGEGCNRTFSDGLVLSLKLWVYFLNKNVFPPWNTAFCIWNLPFSFLIIWVFIWIFLCTMILNSPIFSLFYSSNSLILAYMYLLPEFFFQFCIIAVHFSFVYNADNVTSAKQKC